MNCGSGISVCTEGVRFEPEGEAAGAAGAAGAAADAEFVVGGVVEERVWAGGFPRGGVGGNVVFGVDHCRQHYSRYWQHWPQ